MPSVDTNSLTLTRTLFVKCSTTQHQEVLRQEMSFIISFSLLPLAPTTFWSNYFGDGGIYPIVFDYVACRGWEKNIFDCPRRDYLDFTCYRGTIIGTRCYDGRIISIMLSCLSSSSSSSSSSPSSPPPPLPPPLLLLSLLLLLLLFLILL